MLEISLKKFLKTTFLENKAPKQSNRNFFFLLDENLNVVIKCLFLVSIFWALVFGYQIFHIHFLQSIEIDTWTIVQRYFKFELFWILGLLLFLGPLAFLFSLIRLYIKWLIIFIGAFLVGINYWLTEAFLLTGKPVDGLLYYFEIKELGTLLGQSDGENGLYKIIAGIVLMLFFCFAWFLWNKRLKFLPLATLCFLGAAAFVFGYPKFQDVFYKELWISDFEAGASNNKLVYFINSYWLEHQRSRASGTETSLENTEFFQAAYPELVFPNAEFPALFQFPEKNVLGPFFESKAVRPNIVFIIGESISRTLSGKNAFAGSFTPFLDSLAKESLYWENHISTADLTYGLLPSILAAAPAPPNRKRGLVNLTNLPDHISLPSELKKQGYQNFCFGALDLSFDKMDAYLDYHAVGRLPQKYYESTPSRELWGPRDEILYQKATAVFDSLTNREQSPYFHLYLPMSTHDPFLFEPRDRYLALAAKKSGKQVDFDYPKHQEMLAATLYYDAELKRFFEAYKKRASFENTIFIITGDHQMFSLYGTRNSFHQYSVPLIIFSPLLKRAKSFKGISSHSDLPLSLAALLKENYGLEMPEETHWLSKQMDTSQVFSAKSTYLLDNIYAAPSANRRLVSGNYYLDGNELFKMEEGIQLSPSQNRIIKEKLLKESAILQSIHQLMISGDRISPKQD